MRRRFYVITVAVLLSIVILAAFIVAYTEDSYAKIEFTGSSHAYFVLSYDSTSVTIPSSQNVTVEVLPHANITITAHPDASFTISSWITTGAQVLRTGNDTISLLTGQGGETIRVAAVLLAKPSVSS